MTPGTHLTKGLLVLLVLLAAAPAAIAGTTVSDVRVQGDTVTAIFSAGDPGDDCLLSFATVIAADSIEKILLSGRTQLLKTSVTVSRFDLCTGDILFVGDGNTDVADFQISSDFGTATLTATVPVTDALTGSTSDFLLNLTWTATSKARTANFVESFTDKDLGIRIKTTSHSRMAEAVATGTVIGIGHNFTPGPSDSATIQRFNDGTHTIQKTF